VFVVKIVSSSIHALKIPFVEAFSHSAASRQSSDSIVVKVTTDSGVEGFGEGLPRPYVTGETVATCVARVRNVLLPAVRGVKLEVSAHDQILPFINSLLPGNGAGERIAWHSARCAVELAIADCLLRAAGKSFASILPPVVSTVRYSGIIAAGNPADTERKAARMKAAGLRDLKIKVSGQADIDRVRIVREVAGPEVSLRLDANGAFDFESARSFLKAVAAYEVDCVEQPLPRGDPAELAALRTSSPVPLMADESVVTLNDAVALAANRSCDMFNIRISKCGGIFNSLAMAQFAARSGIAIQLGCQVGETAILSSAGRHLAAHLPGLRFVEGSYGAHLLSEDVAIEDISFGPGGVAGLLSGPGTGIAVREETLAKHSTQIFHDGTAT